MLIYRLGEDSKDDTNNPQIPPAMPKYIYLEASLAPNCSVDPKFSITCGP